MRRREFITTLAGAAATWPIVARAQQPDRARRLAMLMSTAKTDAEGQARVAAVRRGLQELGWTEGSNIRIDYRWAAGSVDRMRPLAAELVGLEPEVILAGATTALVALQEATRSIPIVFAQVSDPVGAGFVATLARPGGNITGLTQHEFTIAVKWLELLKQIAPRVARVAVLYDPGNPASAGLLRAIEPAAPSLGMQLSVAGVRDKAEIARAIEGFAGEPNGGFLLLPGPVGAVNRELIISLAARHQLPAVYPFRYHVVSGGLASYGVDNIELYRRAAWYIDRILKGEKPGELPVQHATKFELVINLKAAKALGLEPPLSLLARTDEVIE
jgi:putative tryptophan/tyrosine transport system substrate-binding protein